MDLTLSSCFVIVNDPDAALAFYRDTLGLELRNDVAREDFRWITVGAASQPGISIVLTNYIQGSPADLDTVAGLVAKGGLYGPHFSAPDLDAVFAVGAGRGRRGGAGADHAAVGRARLRLPRPVRQPRPRQPGVGARPPYPAGPNAR